MGSSTHLNLLGAMLKERRGIEPVCPVRAYTPSVAETHEFSANESKSPQVCALDGTHFAVTGFVGGGALTLYTFSCDSDGTNITLIDSIQVATPVAQNLSLKRIKPGFVALTYLSNTSPFPTVLATFSYDGGFDNLAAIDSITPFGNIRQAARIAIIDDTHFLVLDQDTSDNRVHSFSVDGVGDNITLIDTLLYEDDGAKPHSIGLIDSTHFAINWGFTNNAGKVGTFELDGGFNITALDEYVHGAAMNSGSGIAVLSTQAGRLVILSFLNSTNLKIEGYTLDGSYNLTEVDEVVPNTLSTNGVGSDGGDMCLIDQCHFLSFWRESDNDILVEAHKFDGVSMDPVGGGVLQIGVARAKGGTGTGIRAAQLTTTLAVVVYNDVDDDGQIQTIVTA